MIRKTPLLPNGVPLPGFASSSPLRDKLVPALLVSSGILAIALGVAAHRLHLGHNPELRWIKALLFIFGLGLTIVGGRLLYTPHRAEQVVRRGLTYLGVVSIIVAIGVHPFGLAQDPAFRWKRQLLLSFGLCIRAMAALFPYRLAVKNWLIVRGTKPASVVTRALSFGLRRLAAIPIHLRNRIALLLLPWIMFAINPNWPFQSLGSMDPWYYFGEFIHFPHYQRLNPSYAGERLMWILPGFVLAHILSPVYGVLALHMVFYSISVLSLYYLVSRFADPGTALLSSCLLGCHPLFIGANGWSYVDGASIAYLILSFALIAKSTSSRFPRFYMALAGASWASLVYTYIPWVAFTPCCAYLYQSISGDGHFSFKSLRLRILPFVSLFTLGFAALTSVLQIVHILLYGVGKGFFFRTNIESAFRIGTMKTPWATGNQWIYTASWIVFPVLVCLTCIGLLLQHRRGVITLNRPAIACAVIYLYCSAFMVIMTIRPTQLLEFDYFASILIPILFLAMGLTVFRVPEGWQGLQLYLVVAVSCAGSILSLWKIGLYRLALAHGLGPLYAVGIAGALMRLVLPKRSFSWILLLCALSAISFGLVPAYAGFAWKIQYAGIASTRRIGTAVTLIEDHLPSNSYPAFWIDVYNSNLSKEYLAIMCGSLSHGLSMWRYPMVDPGRVYPPGTFLILITQARDVFADANERMSSAGMPLRLYRQDLVSGGGVSYWLTYLQVLHPKGS